jgi:hypothetical protein
MKGAAGYGGGSADFFAMITDVRVDPRHPCLNSRNASEIVGIRTACPQPCRGAFG